MQTLKYFNDFVSMINSSNSRLYKQSVLEQFKDDKVIEQYLQIAFNPFKVYGISTKKLTKQLTNTLVPPNMTVFELFDYLEKHKTGTTEDILKCQSFIEAIKSSTEFSECAPILQALICKDLSIGVDIKTISKVFPDIKVFNVQLANKYFDKPEYVEGKTFVLTTKIDGGRIIALKEFGHVTFFTRAGQLYEGLVDLKNEMSRFMPDNTCLDGEITLLDKGNLSSKDQYKETMKIVRTKDKEKHGIKMLVFDWMPCDDFLNQRCNSPYIERREALQKLFDTNNFKYFELLPVLYQGSDTTKITELLNEQCSKGEEGLMINICDAPYSFTRTNSLLKCKVFQSSDLRVIDLEEGTGKYANTLGAFICEYKDNTVKVGSGLSEEQRSMVWSDRNSFINSIIEINYFEETSNADGKLSLRFPTFKDFRPDKTEPNY